MNNFYSKALVILICIALSACSGGSDSTATSDSTGTNVSGTALKGIIANGIVKAYPITDGVISDTALDIGEVLTDENGEYSFTLPVGFSGPIKIEIVASDETTMKCDIPTGCGAEPFGSTVPLTAGFSLTALVPEATAGTEVSVAVTPMTHVATELALDNSSATALGLTDDLILVTNSQIANLFGMTDILDYEIVDVTDPEELAAADDGDIEAALLSGALLSSSDGSAESMTATLDSLIETIVANDGQLLLNDADGTDGGADVISMEDIATLKAETLDAAVTYAAESEVVLDTTTLETLATLEAEITAEQTTLAESAPDATTTAAPSATATSNELTQAKAFASDLRDLAYATSLTTSPTAADKVVIGMEQFGTQLDAAALANEVAVDGIADALSMGMESIGQVVTEDLGAITASTTLTKTIYLGWDYQTNTDITVDVPVTVTVSGAATTIAVNSFTYGGATVNLSATLSGTMDEAEDELAGTFDATIDATLAITGTVSNSALLLTINEGSQVIIDLVMAETWSSTDTQSEFSNRETFTGTLNSLNLDLGVSLAQQTGANPLSFTGQLAVDITAAKMTEDSIQVHGWTDGVSQTSSHDETFTATFATSSLTFSGNFADSSGNSFAATLTANASGNGFTLTETYQFEDSWDLQTNQYTYNETDTSSEETATQYVSAGFSLQFDASLPGLTEAAQVVITGNRDSLTTGSGTLKLSYEGILIEATADAEVNTDADTGITTVTTNITATNQDNVVLSLTKAADETVSGTLAIGDTTYATITDDTLGVKVSYSDGTFTIY